MSNTILKGKVTFVNHDKQYVEIEYTPVGGGKAKTINGNVDLKTQQKLVESRLIKKIHQFHIGDTVHFFSKLSDRGDKMIAANIQYQFNEELDTLLNKAKTNNEFTGYIKIIDEKFFIKEIDSYRFFPLEISPWQMKFTERELTEAQLFSIENAEKKERCTAKLIRNSYIPEYYKVQKLFNDKTPYDAEVFLVNDHGIYVYLFNEKMQAKIPIDTPLEKPVAIGEKIKTLITYLSPLKIVVERVA